MQDEEGNINGGDVQRKNVVNNVGKSSLWAYIRICLYKITTTTKSTWMLKLYSHVNYHIFIKYKPSKKHRLKPKIGFESIVQPCHTHL